MASSYPPGEDGGLGIWSAVPAPSAFLASAAASSTFVHHIIPPALQGSPVSHWEDAMDNWSEGHSEAPPEGLAQHHQKKWDMINMTVSANLLLETAPDPITRARLLASRVRESGAWLNILPISSLSLYVWTGRDDSTIGVAVGLRLGAPLCRPHKCHHCGAEEDCLVTDGLSCRWSEGRHLRHAAINNIVHRSLTSAKIPARLEPSGLYRSDRKHPDGIFVGPWKCIGAGHNGSFRKFGLVLLFLRILCILICK